MKKVSRSSRGKQMRTLPFDRLESRRYMAAHIAGSTTSYATIQAAVDAAVAGATINVDAGTYNEMVTVYKQLTINGAKAGVDARTRATTGETIDNGTGGSASFYIAANDVTIDGFTVQGETNTSTVTGAGIVIAPGMYGTHIVNNIIQNNVAGIYLANNSATDAALIQHNLFKTNNNAGANGGRGIYTDGTISGGMLTNVVIDANTFTNNYGGSNTTGLEAAMAFEAATAGKQTNIRITNNTESGNGKGMLFFNTTGVIIEGNSVTTSKDWYSGALRFEGNNHDVTIAYNNIYANTGPGVAVDSSGVAGDSSGFVVSNNNIYGNGTTSGNKLGVVFNQKVYDGPFIAIGNYWGATTGPSGDGPGTGDSVYGNASKATQWSVAKGGVETYSPWATATINIASIPAPAAPSALTATATASNQAVLTWVVNSVFAYNQLVQRSTDGVNFTTVATVSTRTATYTDAGLTSGKTYTYRVVATLASTSSSPSNTASATPAPYQAPSAPTGLAATVNGLTASLTWLAPSYTIGVTGYVIYRNGTSVGTSTTTSFTDTGLAAGTTYVYTVATTDSTGAVSAKSGSATVATAALTLLDGGFETTRVATAGYSYNPTTANWKFTGSSGIAANGSAWGAATAPDGTQVAFIQNANPASKITQTVTGMAAGTYKVSLMLAQRSGYGTQAVSVSLDGVIVGTFTPASTAFATYTTSTFTLTAGSHVFALTGSVTTADTASFIDSVALTLVAAAAVPAAPVSPSAVATSASQVSLSWSAGAGASATSYTVQRSTDGTAFSTIATGITTTAYTDGSGLSAGTLYYYRVLAVNGTGTSPASAVTSATTLSASAVSTPLSSLVWTSATSGYKTPQLNTSVVGNPITIRGVVYPSGIGTHAVSSISYALAGKYMTFQATVGLDDEVIATGGGAVDFQVIGDGVVLFDSGILTRASAAVTLNVSVAGVKTLTLVATNGVTGSIDYDHADWAAATLLSNPAPRFRTPRPA